MDMLGHLALAFYVVLHHCCTPFRKSDERHPSLCADREHVKGLDHAWLDWTQERCPAHSPLGTVHST
jgi:hypothetical protein